MAALHVVIEFDLPRGKEARPFVQLNSREEGEEVQFVVGGDVPSHLIVEHGENKEIADFFHWMC